MSGGRPACACVMCRDYGDRDRLDNFQLRTIVHVAQYGWSVVLVHADDAAPVGRTRWACGTATALPSWRCSAGTSTRPRRSSTGSAGTPPSGAPRGRRAPRGVVRGRAAAFRSIDPRWYDALFPGAMAFYRRPPLPMPAGRLPDPENLFPWQPGTDLRFRRSQPWLWLNPRSTPQGCGRVGSEVFPASPRFGRAYDRRGVRAARRDHPDPAPRPGTAGGRPRRRDGRRPGRPAPAPLHRRRAAHGGRAARPLRAPGRRARHRSTRRAG